MFSKKLSLILSFNVFPFIFLSFIFYFLSSFHIKKKFSLILMLNVERARTAAVDFAKHVPNMMCITLIQLYF